MKSANGIVVKEGQKGVYADYYGHQAEAQVAYANEEGSCVVLLVSRPAVCHSIPYTHTREQRFYGEYHGEKTYNRAIANRFWITDANDSVQPRAEGEQLSPPQILCTN